MRKVNLLACSKNNCASYLHLGILLKLGDRSREWRVREGCNAFKVISTLLYELIF